MKMIKTVTALFALAFLPLCADEADYFFYFSDSGIDYEFDAIRISAVYDTADNLSFNPVSEDGGWYNGFSGAEGYKVLQPSFAGPFPSGGGKYAVSNLPMDTTNMSEYLFFAELLSASGDVVGYSGYADYGSIQRAEGGISGFKPLDLGNFTAAPIPEPSSGLLLLIGGALVGLRRKRRAA